MLKYEFVYYELKVDYAALVSDPKYHNTGSDDCNRRLLMFWPQAERILTVPDNPAWVTYGGVGTTPIIVTRMRVGIEAERRLKKAAEIAEIPIQFAETSNRDKILGAARFLMARPHLEARLR